MKINHKQRARELFCAGYNCAQAVFTAFSDVTKMDEKEALRLSSSFGGGMGRLRETCGAVTGMFMVIGALKGYDDIIDKTVIAEHYQRVQNLAQRFKAKFDTICCRELLQGLQTTAGPVPTERDAEFYKKRPCLIYVETAAEILDEFLAEQ